MCLVIMFYAVSSSPRDSSSITIFSINSNFLLDNYISSQFAL